MALLTAVTAWYRHYSQAVLMIIKKLQDHSALMGFF